jgi:hypothetical protein
VESWSTRYSLVAMLDDDEEVNTTLAMDCWLIAGCL